jgi:hypothetical protein
MLGCMQLCADHGVRPRNMRSNAVILLRIHVDSFPVANGIKCHSLKKKIELTTDRLLAAGQTTKMAYLQTHVAEAAVFRAFMHFEIIIGKHNEDEVKWSARRKAKTVVSADVKVMGCGSKRRI